jgi:hypothetical protein
MDTPKYNGDATIVIDVSDSYWGEPEPKIVTAQYLSSINRQYNAIVKSEANNAERHDKVKDYLVENADELGEHAEEIAKILGLDLETYVEVTVEVHANLTILVPFGKSIEDLSEYDFDVEITCNDGDFEIESADYHVDNLNY